MMPEETRNNDMGKQRLIFYSDARHTHIYAYDPPIRVEDAVAPVDDVAGTGVDTFVYGFGAGLTMYHNTKVGETWAEHLIKAGQNHLQRAGYLELPPILAGILEHQEPPRPGP